MRDQAQLHEDAEHVAIDTIGRQLFTIETNHVTDLDGDPLSSRWNFFTPDAVRWSKVGPAEGDLGSYLVARLDEVADGGLCIRERGISASIGRGGILVNLGQK
jgi:hypothetical protein